LLRQSRGLVPLGAEQEIDCVTGFIDGSVKDFHSPLTLIYVSSIRQLLPTERLRDRNAFARIGSSLIAQRCTVEWSTDTDCSDIISSRCRRLSG